MALSIKSDEADRLARELAARTGETLTEAVLQALRERLLRVSGRTRSGALVERLLAIGQRASALPKTEHRPEDRLYDDSGAPI